MSDVVSGWWRSTRARWRRAQWRRSRTRERSMRRLGFLDWGIGGVGIFQALRRLRPDVPVLYWSDTGATPYGRLPAVDLATRVARVVQAMADQGSTQVVVACNA